MSAPLMAAEPAARYLKARQPALVERFDLLATAPGGVAQLRQLILTLAVRGKLVTQELSKGHASTLVAELQGRRLEAVRGGAGAKCLDFVDFDGATLPCELPAGWAWVRLNDLGQFCGGKTPSKQNAAYWSGSIPWITPKDMKQLRLTDSEDHVSQMAVEDGLALVPPCSLLVVVRSGILRRTVPTAVNEVETTINQDLKALKLSFPEMAPYVQVLIRGFERFILATLTKVGTTVESIRFDEFASQPFPLPPLAEQARIVARVDELMRLCDALDAKGQLEAAQHAQLLNTLLGTLTDSDTAEELAANWQLVAAHFDLLLDRPEAVDTLEQTILQLAVRGRLVSQAHDDEPASAFLQRIRAEKKRSATRKEAGRDESATAINDEPSALPSGWVWTTIDSLAAVGTGTTPSRDKIEYFADGDVPWVTSGETGQPFVRSTEQHVTRLALRETSLTVYPAGALIVAMYGQGKTRGQVSELCISAATNQACAAIVLISPSIAHRAYIKLVFEKSYDEIREQSAGGAQPNLNVGKVRATLIPLPPLAEQARIVARVEQLRSLCAALRQRLAEAQATQCRLAEALVESATA